MSTPEGKVKIWLNDQVKKTYGDRHKWSYAPPGGAFGQSGTMDRILLIESDNGTLNPQAIEKYGPPPGIFVGIEVKAEGLKPTPLQIARLSEIYRAGAVAAELVGKDHAQWARIVAEIEKRRTMARIGWAQWVMNRNKEDGVQAS